MTDEATATGNGNQPSLFDQLKNSSCKNLKISNGSNAHALLKAKDDSTLKKEKHLAVVASIRKDLDKWGNNKSNDDASDGDSNYNRTSSASCSSVCSSIAKSFKSSEKSITQHFVADGGGQSVALSANIDCNKPSKAQKMLLNCVASAGGGGSIVADADICSVAVASFPHNKNSVGASANFDYSMVQNNKAMSILSNLPSPLSSSLSLVCKSAVQKEKNNSGANKGASAVSRGVPEKQSAIANKSNSSVNKSATTPSPGPKFKCGASNGATIIHPPLPPPPSSLVNTIGPAGSTGLSHTSSNHCKNNIKLKQQQHIFGLPTNLDNTTISNRSLKKQHSTHEDITAAASADSADDGPNNKKKRCSDRYDSSESSDSGVATSLSCTDSSTASSDASDPGSPYSPLVGDDLHQQLQLPPPKLTHSIVMPPQTILATSNQNPAGSSTTSGGTSPSSSAIGGSAKLKLQKSTTNKQTMQQQSNQNYPNKTPTKSTTKQSSSALALPPLLRVSQNLWPWNTVPSDTSPSGTSSVATQHGANKNKRNSSGSVGGNTIAGADSGVKRSRTAAGGISSSTAADKQYAAQQLHTLSGQATATTFSSNNKRLKAAAMEESQTKITGYFKSQMKSQIHQSGLKNKELIIGPATLSLSVASSAPSPVVMCPATTTTTTATTAAAETNNAASLNKYFSILSTQIKEDQQRAAVLNAIASSMAATSFATAPTTTTALANNVSTSAVSASQVQQSVVTTSIPPALKKIERSKPTKIAQVAPNLRKTTATLPPTPSSSSSSSLGTHTQYGLHQMSAKSPKKHVAIAPRTTEMKASASGNSVLSSSNCSDSGIKKQQPASPVLLTAIRIPHPQNGSHSQLTATSQAQSSLPSPSPSVSSSTVLGNHNNNKQTQLLQSQPHKMISSCSSDGSTSVATTTPMYQIPVMPNLVQFPSLLAATTANGTTNIVVNGNGQHLSQGGGVCTQQSATNAATAAAAQLILKGTVYKLRQFTTATTSTAATAVSSAAITAGIGGDTAGQNPFSFIDSNDLNQLLMKQQHFQSNNNAAAIQFQLQQQQQQSSKTANAANSFQEMFLQHHHQQQQLSVGNNHYAQYTQRQQQQHQHQHHQRLTTQPVYMATPTGLLFNAASLPAMLAQVSATAANIAAAAAASAGGHHHHHQPNNNNTNNSIVLPALQPIQSSLATNSNNNATAVTTNSLIPSLSSIFGNHHELSSSSAAVSSSSLSVAAAEHQHKQLQQQLAKLASHHHHHQQPQQFLSANNQVVASVSHPPPLSVVSPGGIGSSSSCASSGSSAGAGGNFNKMGVIKSSSQFSALSSQPPPLVTISSGQVNQTTKAVVARGNLNVPIPGMSVTKPAAIAKPYQKRSPKTTLTKAKRGFPMASSTAVVAPTAPAIAIAVVATLTTPPPLVKPTTTMLSPALSPPQLTQLSHTPTQPHSVYPQPQPPTSFLKNIISTSTPSTKSESASPPTSPSLVGVSLAAATSPSDGGDVVQVKVEEDEDLQWPTRPSLIGMASLAAATSSPADDFAVKDAEDDLDLHSLGGTSNTDPFDLVKNDNTPMHSVSPAFSDTSSSSSVGKVINGLVEDALPAADLKENQLNIRFNLLGNMTPSTANCSISSSCSNSSSSSNSSITTTFSITAAQSMECSSSTDSMESTSTSSSTSPIPSISTPSPASISETSQELADVELSVKERQENNITQHSQTEKIRYLPTPESGIATNSSRSSSCSAQSPSPTDSISSSSTTTTTTISTMTTTLFSAADVTPVISSSCCSSSTPSPTTIDTDLGENSCETLPKSAISPILSQPKTIRFPAHNESGFRYGPKGSKRHDGVCYWDKCNKKHDSSSKLLDHMQSHHVNSQTGPFACLWVGCKVYGRESCSRRWLERHVLSHGGTKPFKCIVDGCGLRFGSQLAVQKHVNGHFTATENKDSTNKRTSDPPVPKQLRKNGKKLRYRRQPFSARMFDFFDAGIMEGLQHRLRQISLLTNGRNSITFHGRIMMRRQTVKGLCECFISWSPSEILSDEWLPQSDKPFTKTLNIKQMKAGEKTNVELLLGSAYRLPHEPNLFASIKHSLVNQFSYCTTADVAKPKAVAVAEARPTTDGDDENEDGKSCLSTIAALTTPPTPPPTQLLQPRKKQSRKPLKRIIQQQQPA